MRRPEIVLINGPAAAGKSTVSELLAQHFDRSAVVHVDTIRQFLRKGKVDLRKEDKMREGQRQLDLSTKIASSVANNLLDGGFTVIIDDVVSSKGRLDLYLTCLAARPEVFLLLPSLEVLLKRDLGRASSEQMKEKVAELHAAFSQRRNEESRWNVIDSSSHAPEETARQVLRYLSAKQRRH